MPWGQMISSHPSRREGLPKDQLFRGNEYRLCVDLVLNLLDLLGFHHLAPQVIRREVAVAERHLQVRVAQDLLHRLEPPAPPHQPAPQAVPPLADVEALP